MMILSASVAQGPSYVIILIAVLQFFVFVLSLWAIFKLWMAVIEFVGQRPTEKARLLASVLGRAEVGGSGTALKVKAVGAGLGGTITILGVAVLAMYVLGNHVVTGR
jgi:choline-glycine betaine transporter